MLLRAIKLTRVELQNRKINNTKARDAGVVFCAMLKCPPNKSQGEGMDYGCL